MPSFDLPTLEAIFDATREYVSVVDRGFVYRVVNRTYTELHNLPKEKIIGKHLLDLMDEESFLGAQPKLHRCFDGESLSFAQWFDFRSGKRRFMLVSYVPYQRGEEVVGAIVLVRDDTERELQRLEQERQKSLLLQQGRMAELGRTSAFVSHQWRSLLQVMASHLLKLRREVQEGTPIESQIQSLNRCEKLLEHFSETLHTFSAFYCFDKQKRTFLVKETLETTLKFLQKRLDDLGVEVGMRVDETLQLEGVPNAWMQVLLSLIINALEAFVIRKVAQPILHFKSHSDGEWVWLSITDNARGIDRATKEWLFDGFVTDKEGGSGLGLYFARFILQENFGGDLEVVSETDGTEVRLRARISSGR